LRTLRSKFGPESEKFYSMMILKNLPLQIRMCASVIKRQVRNKTTSKEELIPRVEMEVRLGVTKAQIHLISKATWANLLLMKGAEELFLYLAVQCLS